MHVIAAVVWAFALLAGWGMLRTAGEEDRSMKEGMGMPKGSLRKGGLDPWEN